MPLGPVAAEVWKVDRRGFAGTITAERWRLPDGATLLELSTKTSRAAADATTRDFLAYLASRGIRSATAQETKTRAALARLARR